MTQTAANPEATEQSPWIYSLLFWLLLLAFESLVLSLPLFPTGDSGLHIYYATIFRDLITHKSPLYAQFYAVRHLVQPYLLHYYVFIGLSYFLSADAAEKVIVLIVLATFAIGFRSLVRALSMDSPGLVLLIFPFLFNWPLAMGALNYTFALGLLFFALGCYERLRLPGRCAPRLWRFAVLLLILVLAHPVPLLLLLCVIAVDLLLRWRDAPRELRFISTQRLRLLALGFSFIALLIPMLIADKGQVGRSVDDIYLHLEYFRQIYNASRLGMFVIHGPLARPFNKCFFLLLPASFAIVLASGLLHRLRTRSLTSSDRLAIFSALFLVTSLFAPNELNGSSFFSFRLWLPCWLLGIASCAGPLRGVGWNYATAAYAILLSVAMLALGLHTLRPIARAETELEHAPLPTGKLGLFIQSSAGKLPPLGVGYPLFWWNGGRAFIAHNDVMLNSAWLYLTIIPVREKGNAGLMRDYTLQVATEDPNNVARYLLNHPDEKARALASADFILFADPAPKPDPAAVIRFTLEPNVKDWNCNLFAYYGVCRKIKRN